MANRIRSGDSLRRAVTLHAVVARGLVYALQDLRSFHSLLIAVGLISIIGPLRGWIARGTGSSLDSIVLVGYSSHRFETAVGHLFDGLSRGDGDTDGGCARFIKGWERNEVCR